MNHHDEPRRPTEQTSEVSNDAQTSEVSKTSEVLATSQFDVLGRLLRLIRKELYEILRDRRTITTLILMPLLLYPLLSLAFQQYLLAGSLDTKLEEPQLVLGFTSEDEAQEFFSWFSARRLRLREQWTKTPPAELPDVDVGRAMEVPPEQLNELLRTQHIDLVIRLADRRRIEPIPGMPDGKGQVRPHEVLDWEIVYHPDSLRSVKALRQVQRRMEAINTGMLVAQLPITGPPRIVVSKSTGTALELPETQPEFPLASLVPLILILMTITGAVYPAIDLTAGERERGTLEILVAAPVPRLGLLFAKYVSVLTVAVLTALVNLVMMMLTIWLSGMTAVLFRETELTLLLVLQIFGLLLLFAAFFSAVLLTITSFARSFKEAQAYLIPLMVVSLAPGMAGMLPGLELTPTLSIVPLLNIVLLGRDLFQNNATLGYALLVVGSTLLYAAAAIALAARIFGAENVLYNEQASWTDLFRRPMQYRTSPSLSNVMMCLCLIFFLTFLVQGAVRQFIGGRTPNANEVFFHTQLTLITGVLLFAGLPLASAIWRRIRLVPGFLLRPAHPLAFLGALLLGLSLWPFVLQLLAQLRVWGWTTLTAAQEQQLTDAVQLQREVTPLGLLIFGAVISGVVEELFFRGFLFRALQRISGAAMTILLSALLFAVFHVIATPILGLERFVPSFAMGLILGWVCWRSGSVLPAMLLHGCHNAMLRLSGLLLGTEGSEILEESAHLPMLWLGGAAIGAALGALLLVLMRRSE